jgi:hypothetical protein
MFYDDKTQAFMPYKYYESFATGIKEYKKAKQSDQKLANDEKKAENQQNYQNTMLENADRRMGQTQTRLDQMDKSLGIRDRAIGVSEANAINAAEKTSEMIKKNAEVARNKEEEMAVKEVNTYNDNANEAIKAYGAAFDDKVKTESLNSYKKNIRDLRSAKEKLLKVRNNNEGGGISDEAIKVSMDLQEAVDLMDQYDALYGDAINQGQDAAEKPSTFMNNFGNSFDSKYGHVGFMERANNSDPVASRITTFAKSKGITDTNLLNKIPSALEQGLPPEAIIQAIIDQSKNK